MAEAGHLRPARSRAPDAEGVLRQPRCPSSRRQWCFPPPSQDPGMGVLDPLLNHPPREIPALFAPFSCSLPTPPPPPWMLQAATVGSGLVRLVSRPHGSPPTAPNQVPGGRRCGHNMQWLTSGGDMMCKRLRARRSCRHTKASIVPPCG
jgi:hypothetical protein